MVADLTAILNSHFGSLNPEAREEAVAEAVALAWANYAGLLGKGKGHLATVHTLAYYAAKQVRQGRTIGSGSAKNDVLHMAAAARVTMETMNAGDFADVTMEDRKARPADLAAFRIDFIEFLKGLSDRRRGIALRLAAGFTTMEVAVIYNCTSAAVSIHRRKLEELWREFHGM